MVLDICAAARSVPSFPVERSLKLGEVAAARQAASLRLSWVTLFLRAYGLAGIDIPELRQVYSKYPWPRIYEHPWSVASLSIHRDDPDGGKRLIWARIDALEDKPLLEIQRLLHHAVHGPIEDVFKNGLKLECLPTPLRRLSWWLCMNWQGRQKAKKIGTCSVSTLASVDTLNRGHPLIMTSSIAYSRCDEAGDCLVTLLCDHRVLDGILAAQALHRIEYHLTHQVVDELKSL